MKKLTLFTLILMACCQFAGAQAGIEPGIYEGSGKAQGLTCPVKFRFEPTGVVATFGGACNCVTLLQPTETPMLFQEKDFLNTDGGVRNDACRSREYVFFVRQENGLTVSWGNTAAEATTSEITFILLKIK